MRTKKIRRIFSESFKKTKVDQIESGLLSVSKLAKMLDMHPNPIYVWVRKYGKRPLVEKIVIETESDYLKMVELLKDKSKLEQIIGKQQVRISFYEELLKEVRLHYGEDPEEKFLKK